MILYFDKERNNTMPFDDIYQAALDHNEFSLIKGLQQHCIDEWKTGSFL
jgi:hypothetical protein